MNLKLFFVFGILVGGGVGLWRLWIALSEYHGQFLSEGWLNEQAVKQAILGGQYEGYVGWPWDGDDAA